MRHKEREEKLQTALNWLEDRVADLIGEAMTEVGLSGESEEKDRRNYAEIQRRLKASLS